MGNSRIVKYICDWAETNWFRIREVYMFLESDHWVVSIVKRKDSDGYLKEGGLEKQLNLIDRNVYKVCIVSDKDMNINNEFLVWK